MINNIECLGINSIVTVLYSCKLGWNSLRYFMNRYAVYEGFYQQTHYNAF